MNFCGKRQSLSGLKRSGSFERREGHCAVSSPVRQGCLKISGESLGEFSPSGERSLLDSQRFAAAAEMIAAIHAMGVTTTVVVGGGNIFRGSLADKWELKPEQADEVGMDSTRVNVRLLRFLLFNRGLAPAVFSRGPAEGLGSRYDCEDVRTALHRGEIVLLAGGARSAGNLYRRHGH